MTRHKGGTAIGSGSAIFLADADSFESGYIVSALQAAGSSVIGPLQSGGEVRALLDSGPPPRAVILGNRLADGPVWELVETLRGREIAHLLLIGPPWEAEPDLTGISVLRKPFGAYQVVEWAAQLASEETRPTVR